MFSLLALLSLHARAFAPVETDGVSLEPQRVWWRHSETQGRLLASDRFRAFQATDGRGWTARFDETTGLPRDLWGTGIPMTSAGAQGSRAEIESRLLPLLERHRNLLGFESGTLSVRNASYSEQYDTWYVEIDALREGLPTYRGGISARIKRGNLVLLHAATRPDAPVTGTYAIDADQALTLAITNGPAPLAQHTEHRATPMLLERQGPEGASLRRTFMTHTFTQDPPGRWVSFVDGQTGELLNVHNEVRFIAGTVEGEHHERYPDGSALITSPMPYAFVDGQFDSDLADVNGNYNVTAGNAYETTLQGDYAEVYNADVNSGFLSDNDPNLLWTTADAEQSEIDTYKFIHDVKAWAEDVEPSITSVGYYGVLYGFVDINSNCNAYYDGVSVNFFIAGSGCNNTGEIADVVYHEWGHGFHLFSQQTGVFDGSLSEGAADTVAFFQTGDRYIAPYFGTNGSAIRDVSPNQVYPNDFSNDYYATHSNGLIFGGAMWDLLDLLQDDYGTTAGQDIAEAIFAGLLKGSTDIPSTYTEALVADDDDGDLGNGTPHQCQIDEAFALHGLADPVAAAGFLTDHTPRSIEPDGIPTEIDVELLSAGCAIGDPESGTVHYRVDGGAWQSVSASVSGQHVIGDIPAQDLGTFVEYWVEGQDASGVDFTAPVTGEVAPYSFFVGDVLEIACDDFEANDGGYQHTLVSGDADPGADDWQWGVPAGVGGDPGSAYSGDNVWGNDLGFYGYNGQYQPDKVNRLYGPPVDTLWYTDVLLHYQRWLQVEDSTYDRAVITAGPPGLPGDEVWSNFGGDGDDQHLESQWVAHAVDLQGNADRTVVEIGFEMHTDGGLEFGGWTIDDVCIYAPATPDNRLGIIDLVVEDRGGPIGLTWTNPIHAPVDRVVVVRRVDDWPTSWQDGDIVVDITSPSVGAVQDEQHGNLDGSSGYYAVYASDGTDWLSWTIEGWNAGYAAPNSGGTTTNPPGDDDDDDDTTGDDDDDNAGDDDDDDDVEEDNGGEDVVPEDDKGKPPEASGCACDASGSPALASIPALLALLAASRRR